LSKAKKLLQTMVAMSKLCPWSLDFSYLGAGRKQVATKMVKTRGTRKRVWAGSRDEVDKPDAPVVKKTRSNPGMASSSRGLGMVEAEVRSWRKCYFEIEASLWEQLVIAERARKAAQQSLDNFLMLKARKEDEDEEDGEEEDGDGYDD
jgi:hypothetical protein